ncbi:hypothetical protein LOC67_23030 [Stieleria sp. JC731]|uniref:type VI secretion protein IcmF/TssM N-terminal domain-containing protein n=1 Tax=Pirellulaceae TaxID=2691357 RepID=UPI001E33D1AA|nr:type VI secretion protein IcmF/TssM N-terminal domain-containing protein [Stieleria sp. JC731]MCC9603433.1 hypothetical protein [Stieleria sp. JC731]
MSNAATPEEKPKRKRWYRRLTPQTVAGRAAFFTSLVLWIVLIVVWCLRLFGVDSVRVAHSISVAHAFGEVALAIVIPIVLYFGIKRWNRVIEGEFPDIDRAWEAGVAALEAKGVSPTDFPIFMVLGSSDEHDERGLMEALDSPLLIHGVPASDGVSHALKWYLTPDALYLFCPGASSLSKLMSRLRSTPLRHAPIRQLTRQSAPTETSSVGPTRIERVERKPATAPSPTPATANTPAAPPTPPPPPQQPASRPPQPTGTFMGTIGQHSLSPQTPEPAAPSAFNPPQVSKPLAPANAPTGQSQLKPMPSMANAPFGAPRSIAAAHQGTLMIDQSTAAAMAKEIAQERSPQEPASSATPPDAMRQSSAAAAPPIGTVSTPSLDQKPSATIKASQMAMPQVSASKKIALPENLDTSDQLARLTYVCKLLKRFRRPVCGINGAVTLLPFELSQVGPLQLAAVAQSARNDVTTIQKHLGVRFPVTALLVGLEREAGFIELVRRLGADLLSRRLGGRFDLRSRPTPNELNTHSDRLCDAFEDWVHRLFSRDDGLEQQRGNRKLYSLTCRIRHELKPRLRIVLGQAFGCESNDQVENVDTDEAFFFSGCYFAASGAETGRPAFVKGVLKDKLVDEQSKVQWTEDSLATHRYFRAVCLVGWLFAVILLIVLIMRLI